MRRVSLCYSIDVMLLGNGAGLRGPEPPGSAGGRSADMMLIVGRGFPPTSSSRYYRATEVSQWSWWISSIFLQSKVSEVWGTIRALETRSSCRGVRSPDANEAAANEAVYGRFDAGNFKEFRRTSSCDD